MFSISEKEICCPPGLMYVPEGSACPPTCEHPNGNPDCPTKNVEGCQCPPGQVQKLDENGNVHCVNPSECFPSKSFLFY